MDRRLELHQILKSTSQLDRVYYQPHENVKLVYPCLIYSLDGVKTEFGDDHGYIGTKQYQLTIITRDPETPVLDRLLTLPMCTFSTSFVKDQLYHYILRVYY